MKKSNVLRILNLSVVMVLLAALLSVPAGAKDTAETTVEANTAVMAAPVREEAQLLNSPPELTAEQEAQLKWGEENTGRTIPVDNGAANVAGPVPGTESNVVTEQPRPGAPLAPGDPMTYYWTAFGGAIPAGFKSNIMESSVDGKSRRLFFTGNWFSAYSTNKGLNWTYLSSFTGFPSFCCDQIILHDAARDIYLWLRMGSADAAGQNVFLLSVAFANAFTGGYWTYTTAPTNTNGAWTNQWWDYPHMQITADFLYLAWNMFDWNGTPGTGDDFWVRTVVLKWPLDALAAAAGFSYSYYDQAQWFTVVPVSGAEHTMYFASNWDTVGGSPWDTLRIWRWNDDSGSLSFWTPTIAAWTGTGRGSMHCGVPNYLARGDQRVLTGARYSVSNDGIAEPRQLGRKVLGWWWNVAEGGGFTYPYIEGAAFFEDTMTQLPGFLGRPYVYGGWCFSYPSFFPNRRGDLGGVFNFSIDPDWHKPRVAYSIADDYWHAPPGWDVRGAVASGAGPSDAVWGDYNTARAYQRGTVWIAGVHYIPGAANCANCSVPLYFSFGRERDRPDFNYW